MCIRYLVMRRYYYVEMIKVRYGFSVAEGWGWTWANGISDERFWSHTSLTWQSVFRADFSQSPETLHIVSRTGKQENTPHTGGEAPIHATGHSFPYAVCVICYLTAYSLKKGCSSLFPLRDRESVSVSVTASRSRAVQPGSCASRQTSLPHV